jgi:hypothetical protein
MIRLSEIKGENKSKYLAIYNMMKAGAIEGIKVLKPTKDYDDFGLRFPSEYLSELRHNLIFFPLEIIAEYVDIVTKENIDQDNKEFIYHMVHELNTDVEYLYEGINATGIGNLGYIALNCKDEKAREICEKCLDELFVKSKGLLLNLMNETINPNI